MMLNRRVIRAVVENAAKAGKPIKVGDRIMSCLCMCAERVPEEISITDGVDYTKQSSGERRHAEWMVTCAAHEDGAEDIYELEIVADVLLGQPQGRKPEVWH